MTRGTGIRVRVKRRNMNDGYLITPNALFRGTGVYAGLGVHERIYLGAGLSCSDDFDTTLDELDECVSSIGRDKREAIRRTLREQGFLTLERVSDGHTFVWAFMFHMDPLPADQRDVLPAKKTKSPAAKRVPPQLRRSDTPADGRGEERAAQPMPGPSGHGRSPDGQGMAEALVAQGLGDQGDVYKEEKNHLKKNQDPPPPVVDQPTGGDPPGAVQEEEGRAKPEKTVTIDAYVAWFSQHTSWPSTVVTETLTAAVERGLGDVHRCARALRELAEGKHGKTDSPRRLLYADGPWWKTPNKPAEKPRNRKEGPRCPVVYHEREPADGCLMCASDRIAADGEPQASEGERRAVRRPRRGRTAVRA